MSTKPADFSTRNGIVNNSIPDTTRQTDFHRKAPAADSHLIGTNTDSDNYRVIRRNGRVTLFNADKITIAITKAFLAVEGSNAVSSKRIHNQAQDLSEKVVYALTRSHPNEGVFHIEDIQDHVELALMRDGYHKIARSYVLYREERKKKRDSEQPHALLKEGMQKLAEINVVDTDGKTKKLDIQHLSRVIGEACHAIPDVNEQHIITELERSVFDTMNEKDLSTVLVMSAKTMIEKEPNYTYVAAHLLMDQLRREALTFINKYASQATVGEMQERYQSYFHSFIDTAIQLELLDPKLKQVYDLDKLGQAIVPERDQQFTYLGIQTLYDRYFLHHRYTRIELPQAFFMRVAMGLAMNEKENNDDYAIEFYHQLSTFAFMNSTPTLFNSATLRPQMSSCYLSTVPDDLFGIFDSMRDNAMLSKFAGGLGNDWTRVRAMKSHIKGTNGESQGIVPFLKVANDTAVAVNQGGKRKGALCSYLETWHLDILEFIELRKNTGDDRRRTHDMNTANWIPDLFMKRVAEDKTWTLFSPDETPDLHDLYGRDFDKRYVEYEHLVTQGKIQNFKQIKAVELWKKMLGMLYETGHPWITFKDVCNLRSPQQHTGVVHSSNLCTEITLNTSDEEIAVCNLGSINLAAHVDDNGLILDKLEKTINTAMRMLDNVIDYNYYSVDKARVSNFRHRPVGLGLMGFQDALYKLNLPYASDEAVEFADRSMEIISYYAIKASCELARERGPYESFDGSLWSKGILPIDSLDLLQEARCEYLNVDRSTSLDWESLRQQVQQFGMRNSNVLAIAPTATISNVCGVSQSIEPTYQNLYVKSNLSGEFTVVNPYLAAVLKQKDLWDDVMVNDLKYYDGSVANIDRIPKDLKEIYATAFEINPCWLVEAAARRQKWLDQSQSLNLYMREPYGKKMDSLYKLAWLRGLKTTYYLRSRGATHVEKSTLEDNNSELNAVRTCSIVDPECEACE